MKYHIGRGCVPQCKDFPAILVLRALLPIAFRHTWVNELPAIGSAGHIILQDMVEATRGRQLHHLYGNTTHKSAFYFAAFGFNTPPKIALAVMKKLAKKRYIVSGDADKEPPEITAKYRTSLTRLAKGKPFDFPRKKLLYASWKITEKGYEELLKYATKKKARNQTIHQEL